MMDTYLVNKFTKKFSDSGDRAMPNEDAKYIRTLIEDGDYYNALDKLIDYFGENSVQALNWRIGELKGEVKSLENDVRDLRRSNDAEHSEKAKYFDLAQDGANILKRITEYDVAAEIPDLAETMEDAETFVSRAKSESLA